MYASSHVQIRPRHRVCRSGTGGPSMHYIAETDSSSSTLPTLFSSSARAISPDSKLRLSPDRFTDDGEPKLKAAMPPIGLAGLDSPVEVPPDRGEAHGRGYAPEVCRDDVRLSTNVDERDRAGKEESEESHVLGTGDDSVKSKVLRLGRVCRRSRSRMLASCINCCQLASLARDNAHAQFRCFCSARRRRTRSGTSPPPLRTAGT